jgi:formylmethanofuran dehydrogenase subunit B
MRTIFRKLYKDVWFNMHFPRLVRMVYSIVQNRKGNYMYDVIVHASRIGMRCIRMLDSMPDTYTTNLCLEMVLSCVTTATEILHLLRSFVKGWADLIWFLGQNLVHQPRSRDFSAKIYFPRFLSSSGRQLDRFVVSWWWTSGGSRKILEGGIP